MTEIQKVIENLLQREGQAAIKKKRDPGAGLDSKVN